MGRGLKVISLLICLLLSNGINANPVERDKAAIVAENFYCHILTVGDMTSNASLQPELSTYYFQDLPVFFIAGFQEGFVLLSTDSDLPPILGYSAEGFFDIANLPPALDYFLKKYAEELISGLLPDKEASKTNDKNWDLLYNGMIPADREALFRSEGVPLLTSSWNQNYPYNKYCPADPDGPGGHAYAGCVATAMAQVMYYYRWPAQGSGSHAYFSTHYDTIKADFGNTIYRWEEMCDAIHYYSNDAIAELMFHCGVSINTSYSSNGSGAYSIDCMPALQDYFGYSDGMRYILRADVGDAYSDSLKLNIDAGMPVIYRGGSFWESHSFVCDGYQGDYFHFNFGWSGSGDGYYLLDGLTPFGYNLVPQQAALTNIHPGQGFPCHCNGCDTLSDIKGSFTDGSGPYSYLPNKSCSWLISPDNLDVSQIIITMKTLDTEENIDVIRIYEGPDTSFPLLYELSGQSDEINIIAHSGEVLVTFTTNGEDNRQGFMAEYICLEYTFCQPVNSHTWLSQWLFDNSGPYPYADNTYCSWMIQPYNPSVDSISGINIVFSAFGTEENHDYLRIFSGTDTTQEAAAILSGSTLPSDILLPAETASMVFTSDGSGTGDGWSLRYEIIYPEYCSDTVILTEPAGTVSDGSGSKKYVNGSDCYWLIEPAEATDLTLTFTAFDLENGYDRLKIYDPSQNPPVLLADLTGRKIPAPVNSPSGAMLLYFSTDANINADGWEAEYQTGNFGIAKNGQEEGICIYPLPAHEEVFIEFSFPTRQNMQITFYGCNGTQICSPIQISPGNKKIRLDISPIPPGLYFLEILGGNERSIHKLLKTP
ncbi:MAG: C10 family peptidase [Bacteroidetes bacterium]|nr:C10 family peptidase [Bacteroidota bacterium]